MTSKSSIADEHKDIIYKFTVRQIYDAIINDKEYAMIFFMGDTNVNTAIHRDFFVNNLKLAMTYFVSVENYEWASICKDVISLFDKHVVNKFIDSMEE